MLSTSARSRSSGRRPRRTPIQIATAAPVATTSISPEDPVAHGVLAQALLLVLVAICSYGVQVLLDRQRQAELEAREFGFR